MVDSADSNAAWADQWIAQQRERLEKGAAAAAAKGPADATAAGSADSWSKLWSDLGIAWLGGIVQSMQGAGAAGAAGTLPPVGEALEALRTACSNSLAQAAVTGGWPDLLNRTPPLGLFREQTEAWRAVAAAQVDCQRLAQEYAAAMRRIHADALSLLERRVQGLRARGAPVQGFRELYDLWVECSEEVFGTVAHSSAYSQLQGEMGNATIRLRARIQKVIEQGMRQFDLPTRSEINSVHHQLRQLRHKLAELQNNAAAAADASEPVRPSAARQSTPARSAAAKRPRAKPSAATRRKQPTRAPRRSR